MPIEIQSFEFGEHTGYHRVFVTIHMQTDRGPHCFPLGFIEDQGSEDANEKQARREFRQFLQEALQALGEKEPII